MNKKIIKNSIVFMAVAFFVFGSSQALAYVPGVWDPQPQSINANIPAFTPIYMGNDTQVVNQPTVATNQNVNYYTPTNNMSNNNVPNNTSKTYTSTPKNTYNTYNTYKTYTTTPSTTKTVAVANPAQERNYSNYPTNGNINGSFIPSNGDQSGQPMMVNPNINNGNDLPALSVQGSGGFMPSSVFQWILVILFILAIILIARRLSRPQHDEVHTISAH